MPTPRARLDEPDIPNLKLLALLLLLQTTTERIFLPALIQRPPLRDGVMMTLMTKKMTRLEYYCRQNVAT